MTLVLAGALVLALAVPLVLALVRRPQRGVLLLAALLPFDGLLLVVPGGGAASPWKEALTLLVLGATLVAPASARRAPGGRLPAWTPVLVGWVALGVLLAAVAGGLTGLWGLKIGYFYLLVPVILWRCPLTRRDRDRLVTVLMVTGTLTAAIGLGQQVVGPERLDAMGYEYNTAIRFAGSLLRSFSTFTQPFSFGLFVMLVLLVCLPVALTAPRRPRNTLFLASSPLLVLGMATAVVRGAILGLVVGGLVLVVRRYRTLLHAVPLAVVGLLLLPTAVLTAFFSSDSLGERTTGWGTVASFVSGAPWGNGLGLTGASAERALQAGAPVEDVLVVDGQLYLPDNQFVKVAVELGVVGLWLLLLLGACVMVAAARAARTAEAEGRPDDRALLDGILAATVAAAAASLVSTYLEIFPLDFYFWLLTGVLLCSDRPSSSTPSPSDPGGAASRPTSASSSAP